MGWRDWTGVGERRWKTAPNEQVQPAKTLWDLLQLLIVPVILVGISLWWSASQDSRDKSRAEQVQQDTTLKDYIQQISDLMLNKKLQSSKEGDAVRAVARTVTLTTLRRLDGQRKGEVVRFLQEAGLISGTSSIAGTFTPPVYLTEADLVGAELASASLYDADLQNADLRDADLTNAYLEGAHLSEADLRNADLTNAYLADAHLDEADLKGAIFRGAYLYGVKGLTERGAILRGADVTGAKGVPKRRR